MPRSVQGWAGLAGLAALGLGALMPNWAMFLVTVGFAKGLVVLGLLVLWRTGLVSFGQGLFYGLGAYTVGLVPTHTGIRDIFLLVTLAVVVAAVTAFLLGFLLRLYRDIFFAMLNMAFSMILYGLLVKSETLGSTDGFNIVPASYFGYVPQGRSGLLALYAFAAVIVAASALLVAGYLRSMMGNLTTGIRDNELRVEYLGFSVRYAVHFKIVVAAALAGAGGAIAAIAIGHIDPEMVWWIQSGEFVFVTILSGTGHVVAPFVGSIVFELLRSFALQYAPAIWQLIVGGALLLVIMFLPGGLWSLLGRSRPARTTHARHPRSQEST